MRVLTIIPTYNEIESLPLTLGRLRDAVPESDVLVVDDASPDGTDGPDQSAVDASPADATPEGADSPAESAVDSGESADSAG